MGDYIKRLRQCIRWFQQLEGNYVTEQEKLKHLLEVAEKKCNDLGKNECLFKQGGQGYSLMFLQVKSRKLYFEYFNTSNFRFVDEGEGR